MTHDSICNAAAQGDVESVVRLLDQSPGLVNEDDQYGWPPIFHAALNKRYELVKALIARGADLSAHNGYVMHYAGEVVGNKRVVELLMS